MGETVMTAAPLALLPFAGPSRRGEPLLAVRVHLEPFAQPRPRARARLKWVGGKQVPIAQVYDPPELDGFYAAVVAQFEGAGFPRVDTWCIAQIVHVATRPPALPRHVHVRKVRVECPPDPPNERAIATYDRDLDNLCKATLDGLVHAGVLLDDRLVVGDGGSCKVYGRVGEGPSIEVRLWRAW
jgi:hypothetical protein